MMKKILFILSIVLMSCNTSTKQYLVYPYIEKTDTLLIKGNSISFHTLGLYARDYGMYTDDAWAYNRSELYLYTRPLPYPVTIGWITDEQVKYGIPPRPFYFSTGGIESDSVFRPPFHIQVQSKYLYRADVLESVWLLNEATRDSTGVYYREPTRELDLFESGFEWNRRLWMADHFGDRDYTNRTQYISHILLPPRGINQVDIFVYKNYALRYLNGRLIQKTIKDLDYNYRVLVTIIVNTEQATSVDWEIYKLEIEQLEEASVNKTRDPLQ